MNISSRNNNDKKRFEHQTRGNVMDNMERKRELIQLLFQKYGSLLLTREQVAEVLNISTASLDRMKQNGVGIQYQKDGQSGKNGKIRYPVDAVAEFIVQSNIQTA